MFDTICLSFRRNLCRGSRPRHSGHQHPRRKPDLESLEGRALLSSWIVNSIGDSGDGTLRWAITQANGDTDPAGALIQFDPAVFSTPQTITLGSQLELTNTAVPETIGAANVSPVTVSGNSAVRVLQVDGGVTARITALTISSGMSDVGGGIYSAGSLTLANCIVTSNQSIGPGGGGVYIAPGSGVVTLEGNTFSSNMATGATGAPGEPGGNASGGGLLVEGGVVNLVNNTFSGNTAVGGTGGDLAGGLYPLGPPEGDIWWNDGTYLYHYQPFNGVWSVGWGGDARGGGLAVSGGTVSLVSNTFSENSAYGGNAGQGGTADIWFDETDVYDPSTGELVDHYENHIPQEYGAVGGSGFAATISGTIALLQNNDFTAGSDMDGVDAMVPLAITQFTVNPGESQRSNIESVSVQFNQDTNLPALVTSGTITTAVQVVGASGPLSLTADRYHYDPSTFTLTIDLTVGAGSHRTMLSDGRYQLQLDTSQITALGSSVNHLNLQNEAPSLDGQVRYGFFRLLGDLSGDGVVNSQDLVIERNQIIGYAGALPTTYGDINGDGVVDINDYIALRLRLGKHL
jgi:hypothetical protein